MNEKDKRTNKESIMVFIPAYNCMSQIVRVLEQFTPDIASRFDEIVVIENRSSDNTLDVAQRKMQSMADGLFPCKLTLLQNKENYSLGGSHKVAFNYCIDHSYDYMVVLHGDDQGSISDLIPLIDAGEHRRVDCLLGARFMEGSKLIGYSKFRTFGNIALNAFISLASGYSIKDMGSGLNMYKADFLKSKFYMGFPNNLTFNVYMLYYAIWRKSPILFFPLSWREDDQISNAKMFRQAWQILKLTMLFVAKPSNLLKQCGDAMDYQCVCVYHSE